jgi:hypothetical protein
VCVSVRKCVHACDQITHLLIPLLDEGQHV